MEKERQPARQSGRKVKLMDYINIVHKICRTE